MPFIFEIQFNITPQYFHVYNFLKLCLYKLHMLKDTTNQISLQKISKRYFEGANIYTFDVWLTTTYFLYVWESSVKPIKKSINDNFTVLYEIQIYNLNPQCFHHVYNFLKLTMFINFPCSVFTTNNANNFLEIVELAFFSQDCCNWQED